MSESKFKALMAMSECSDAEYQRGYRRGLRRLFHGENFGTADEHEKFMLLSGCRKKIGDGYRDGFAGNNPVFRDNND